MINNSPTTGPKVATTHRASFDGSQGLVMVSFRGDREVIDELKGIAKRKGRPYQALLRQALKDYVELDESKSS